MKPIKPIAWRKRISSSTGYSRADIEGAFKAAGLPDLSQSSCREPDALVQVLDELVLIRQALSGESKMPVRVICV